MSDKKMEAIATSKVANIAYSFFKEEVDKEQIVILNRMKQLARDSKHELSEYAGGLIAMNHLDNLVKRLEKQIRLGNEIEKDMNNGT